MQEWQNYKYKQPIKHKEPINIYMPLKQITVMHLQSRSLLHHCRAGIVARFVFPQGLITHRAREPHKKRQHASVQRANLGHGIPGMIRGLSSELQNDIQLYSAALFSPAASLLRVAINR